MSSRRMTISDVVKKYPDKCFYIGGQSGYFFIGTAEDVQKKIPKINENYIMYMCDKFRNATNGGIKRKYDRQLSRYVDIQSRKVKEYYKRIEDGIAIILDDSEDLFGRFWFKEEFKHGTEKN